MTDATDAILAIDLGTSELKAGLVAADGRVLRSARAGYGIAVAADAGHAEQDPETWWAALRRVCAELTLDGSARVVAVCTVGQGPTLVAVDGTGRATYAALTWMDARPQVEAQALEALTGLSPWRLGILPAARWLERTAPAAVGRTRWYLNSWEWAAFRLTGVAAMTRAVGQTVPSPDEARAAGVAAERLPDVIEAGSLIGELATAAADELRLPAGIPVVAGTVDSFASFHGAGLRDAGDAIDTGGTSGGIGVYLDADVLVDGLAAAPAGLPNRWLVGGAMTATGKGLTWFDEQILGAGPGPDALIAEAANVRAGADGLLFLPYLAGERSPIWDPLARGALIGLTVAHGRAHVTRAILEAAALAMRHVVAPILAAGVSIRELRVTGGTARSEAWNQIKADVLGVRVAVPVELEAAIVGAATLAAPAIGWQPDTLRAIECMVRIDHRLEPNPAHREVYDRLFAAYVQAWPAIAPIVHDLHVLQGPVRPGP